MPFGLGSKPSRADCPRSVAELPPNSAAKKKNNRALLGTTKGAEGVGERTGVLSGATEGDHSYPERAIPGKANSLISGKLAYLKGALDYGKKGTGRLRPRKRPSFR